MEIKAVIFDMAGVLLLTVKGNFNSLLAERLGARLEDVTRVMNDEVNDRWDLGEISDEEFYTHLLTELKQPIEKKSILACFMIDDFYIDLQMLDFIHELHQTYQTALLTNFPAHLHDFMRTQWKTSGAFDHVIASCDVKLLKPDPRMYQAALDILGCQPSEAIFVDDREVNVKGAEAVGIRSVHYLERQQGITEIKKLLETE
jgi:putative hydrolase of the HAD superfamily